MALSSEQRCTLNEMLPLLSEEGLQKLKTGNVEGVRDQITQALDPRLIREHEEMRKAIQAELEKRKNE